MGAQIPAGAGFHCSNRCQDILSGVIFLAGWGGKVDPKPEFEGITDGEGQAWLTTIRVRLPSKLVAKAYYVFGKEAYGRLTVITKLATSLGRRDELPNLELADEIAKSLNDRAVAELVENLSNKDNDIASDCIKVLYEIGARNPRLVMKYAGEFGGLLHNKNNRLVWGGMTALDAIASANPKSVHDQLGEIESASKGSSVIARDHAVGIFVKLAASREYREEALALLLDQLKTCPANQFPMYAEMSAPAFDAVNRAKLQRTLKARLNGIEKESQRRRVDKVLRRLA